MLILYHGGGASDYNLGDESFRDEYWERIKQSTCKLLRARGSEKAVELLETIPFSLFNATNGFGDEFCVLIAYIPFEAYLPLSEIYKDVIIEKAASDISHTLSETSSHYARFVVVGLDNSSVPETVAAPTLQVTSIAVERALADAEQLIRTRDAISGVDRVHTAFHGYLRAVVIKMGLKPDNNAGTTQLFKIIKENHQAFKLSLAEDEEVTKILRATATILDALNPIRNRASIAHPNERMIEEPEAMLVVNIVRTLLHYLNSKIGSG
jgi:hypothetical protein